LVEFRVGRVLDGAVVVAPVAAEFEPVDELDVGALVDLGGVASRVVGNEEPKRRDR
jgi:hypothetical protein